MGKMCFLCRRKASKRDRVSLFMIPKEPVARNKWMKVCDLLPTDDLRCIYICSMHFSSNHVDRGNEFQTRCTLKMGAVPSIGVPNPMNFDDENIKSKKMMSKKIKIERADNEEEKNKAETPKACNNNDEVGPQLLNTLENVIDRVSTQELRLPIHTVVEVPFEQSGDAMERLHLGTDFTRGRKVNEDFDKADDSSKPKRRVFEPRYISEIRIPDFKTPEITRRILNMIRETDRKKSKLIKSLQDRNRKLQKRISSLKQIVALIKKKNAPKKNTANRFDHSYATRPRVKKSNTNNETNNAATSQLGKATLANED